MRPFLALFLGLGITSGPLLRASMELTGQAVIPKLAQICWDIGEWMRLTDRQFMTVWRPFEKQKWKVMILTRLDPADTVPKRFTWTVLQTGFTLMLMALIIWKSHLMAGPLAFG